MQLGLVGAVAWATPPSLDFSLILNETAPLTRTIATDEQALTVMSQLLIENTHRSDAVHRKQPRNTAKPLFPEDLAQLGIQFTREVGIYHWSSTFSNILKNTPIDTVRSSYENQQPSLNWIKSNLPQSDLHIVLSLTTVFLELSAHSRPTPETWAGYHDFAEQMLGSFPDWAGSDSTWLSVVKQEGTPGILQRLKSYWNPGAFNNDLSQSDSIENREGYIGRFLQQQVIPIVKAHLIVSLLGLQTQSEHQAWKTWQKIQEWKTKQNEQQDLARLCGTWQWLIHNHQNHGDHKTVMVYPPPSQFDRMDPKPAKIQVQGNTVYIRWEFSNGIIQEESLLLSEKDRMLSGTFVNNMGPTGNISGRRIAPCKNW